MVKIYHKNKKTLKKKKYLKKNFFFFFIIFNFVPNSKHSHRAKIISLQILNLPFYIFIMMRLYPSVNLLNLLNFCNNTPNASYDVCNK